MTNNRQAEECRAAFEKWFEPSGKGLTQDSSGNYLFMTAHSMWLPWQAAWNAHTGVITEWERDMKGTLATLEALKAENAAMREELEELAKCDGSPSNVANAEILAKRVRSSARKALAQSTIRRGG